MVHSDAMFVMAFPRECTEAFLEAHARAFEFFGCVPKRISYDNTRVAITKILKHHKRKNIQVSSSDSSVITCLSLTFLLSAENNVHICSKFPSNVSIHSFVEMSLGYAVSA